MIVGVNYSVRVTTITLAPVRLLAAIDDFINPKVGQPIFGCDTIFDHAAKANQSQYPWAQNVVLVGLPKRVKGRWSCIFLSFCHYVPIKTITVQKPNAKIKAQVAPSQTKPVNCSSLAKHFANVPVFAVIFSWFGNVRVLIYNRSKQHLTPLLFPLNVFPDLHLNFP